MDEGSYVLAKLRIEMTGKLRDVFLKSMEPDNQNRIKANNVRDGIEITIADEKISTIANVVDDLIRCFEVFEKIEER
ncbi:MAG: hypothetical protein M1327_01865 [Candidatus Thermoplasmatota archaeon]|nr:hypothetical protein [Candidatus Thermoplasmatota archaeon]